MKRPPDRESEPPLKVTVTGLEEETPELWADLIEFVLDALGRERRKRNEGKDHAA